MAIGSTSPDGMRDRSAGAMLLQAAGSLRRWRRARAVAQAAGARGDARAAQQSVSRWCYQKIALPDFCRAVAAMGLPAIDLLEPADWPVVREHGLICSMGYGGGGIDPRRPQQPRQSRSRSSTT